MQIWQAILMGIVQGLTEFLPISSTAHLRLTPEVFGFKDPGAAFTAIIQLGTLVAVIWYFGAEIYRLALGWIRGIVTGKPWETLESRQGWMIIMATIPIVVLGIALKPWIKDTDGTQAPLRVITAVAIQLLIGSVLMAIADWVSRLRHATGKTMEQLSWYEVIGTGLFQALALLPGMSRSGSTISGGLLLGMSRETATRFSFLLSLPAVAAAGLYSIYSDVIKPWLEDGQGVFQDPSEVTNLVIATIVSGVVGYAAIAVMLRFLRTRQMTVFIVYRVMLALFLLFVWQHS